MNGPTGGEVFGTPPAEGPTRNVRIPIYRRELTLGFDAQEAERLAAWLQDYRDHGGPVDYEEAAAVLRAAVERVRELEERLSAQASDAIALTKRVRELEPVVKAARELMEDEDLDNYGNVLGGEGDCYYAGYMGSKPFEKLAAALKELGDV